MFLKREDLQPVFSFKLRGAYVPYHTRLPQESSSMRMMKAILTPPSLDLPPVPSYNKIAHLTPEQKANGIVCCSAGNHAQGQCKPSTPALDHPQSQQLRSSTVLVFRCLFCVSLGVAMAAKASGVAATIVMPLATPAIKVEGVKKFKVGGLPCMSA